MMPIEKKNPPMMTSNTKPTTRSTSVIIVYVVLKFVTLARKITRATITNTLRMIKKTPTKAKSLSKPAEYSKYNVLEYSSRSGRSSMRSIQVLRLPHEKFKETQPT